MRSMKKLILIASLVMMAFACVCCTTTTAATTTNLTIGEEVASGHEELQINKAPSVDVIFTLQNPRRYGPFIKNLRNRLKDPGHQKFKIPMLRGPSKITDSNRFQLVRLSTIDGRVSITLALRMSDTYVVGYCCGKENTAWFFTAESREEERQNNLLFRGASQNYLGYKGNYGSLSSRVTPLGPQQMGASLVQLANTEKGKDTVRNKNSLVVLIQMVAEAARFEYISKEVEAAMKKTNGQYTPDQLAMSYQNNWGALSKAVATSTDGVFKNEVVLSGRKEPVKTVKEVENDLSLLTYIKTGKN